MHYPSSTRYYDWTFSCLTRDERVKYSWLNQMIDEHEQNQEFIDEFTLFTTNLSNKYNLKSNEKVTNESRTNYSKAS